MYGYESWTISQTMQGRLEAAERCFLRRMLGRSWMDRMADVTVLRMADIGRDINDNCKANTMFGSR